MSCAKSCRQFMKTVQKKIKELGYTIVIKTKGKHIKYSIFKNERKILTMPMSGSPSDHRAFKNLKAQWTRILKRLESQRIERG